MKRFWSFVEKTASCWVWKGCLTHDGYGRFQVSPKTVLAHRFSYGLVHKIRPGLLVLHKTYCTNRRCVRPSHLYQGTHTDNMKDKAHVGASAGERNGNAKLTSANVREIRRRRREGERTVDLAAEFAVDRHTISGITKKRRGYWRDLR